MEENIRDWIKENPDWASAGITAFCWIVGFTLVFLYHFVKGLVGLMTEKNKTAEVKQSDLVNGSKIYPLD